MIEGGYVSCVPASIKVEQMQLIRNLIELQISDEQLNMANFTDGIEVQVRSVKPFTVNALWIVKIKDLHEQIGKEWVTMRDELWDNKFLAGSDKCLFRIAPQIYQESNATVKCKIKPPQPIDTSSMTAKPRDFYPLVIIVTCYEEEPNPGACDAAASINIVHIRDVNVPIKSHLIKQYIKQIDGRILDVSQLFVDDTSCFICFEEAKPEENLQLFCLLPCRHSPICSNCVTRIRECPKCRCHIASVFDINSPPANLQQGSRPTIDPSIRHLYDDANGENGTDRPRRGRIASFFTSMKSMFDR